MKRLAIAALLLQFALVHPAVGQQPPVDEVSQKASSLEAELGKYKDSSVEAGDVMYELTNLYHANGRVFGLIRVAQRFVASHPTDPRHEEVMLKLIDGQQATSRNKELSATCRQYLVRYPEGKAVADIELRLAQTLDELNDRSAAADAHRAVWNRQPKTEQGRRSGALAVAHYASNGNKNVYSKAAELAEEMHDKLAAGSFTEELGWQAVAQWRRGSEWARSNQAAVKLLKKTPKMAAERLRLLHYYMGENYRSLGLHANSVESYRQARELRDTPEVHFQMITAMYNNAAVKPGEMEPVVQDYLRKYPERRNRFQATSYLALAYLRNQEQAKAAGLFEQLLPVDPRTNSNANQYLKSLPAEESEFAKAEKALVAAISQSDNVEDQAYLRYVLAFDLYRDRIKNLDKARNVLRDIIAKSPTNDSYTRQAVEWLLYNSESPQAFQADVNQIVKSATEHWYLPSLRSSLESWAKAAGRRTEHKENADLVQAAAAKIGNTELAKAWSEGAANSRSSDAAQTREQLIKPEVIKTLPDYLARYVLNNAAYYYRNYGPSANRPRAAQIYARLLEYSPEDYETAIAYVQAATDYSPPEVRKEAALALLKFEPQSVTSDLFRRLVGAADQNNDVELLQQVMAWIHKAEEKHGLQMQYAYAVGDVLKKHMLTEESLAYWRSHLDIDPDNVDTRYCAERILATLEGADRLEFLKSLTARNSDYHGAYAMWLAHEYLAAGDVDNFEKTLATTRTLQNERPFRTWGFEENPTQAWVDKYRANQDDMLPLEDRRRVLAAVRDLELHRPSAAAALALLELDSEPRLRSVSDLLIYQAATRLVGDTSTDWDRLRPYVDSAIGRKQYIEAATLLTGMLSNIPSADARRQQQGRELVAQSYSRIGAVGLTIDASSPIAPLLQAALYLRLGDSQIALDTYNANRALFDQRRDEVPVDLLLFVCENHMASGGDENHDRVEEILRTWLVRNTDADQFEDKTKAEVQLLLARNFAKARRYDVARSEFTSVMNRFPATPQALEAEFGIGETFMAQKVYDQAEAVFEKLANSRERDVVVRAEFLRGVLAHRRGDRDEARDIFRSVLERVPNIELANQALFNLAEVYGAEERYIDQLNLLRTVGRLGRSSKRWHAPGTPLSIVVQDSDLGISQGRSEINVIVTTEPGGDREIIKLVTGATKGLFRADLDTRLGQVTQNDHILQLSGKDVIRCDYPEEFKQEFQRVPLSDVEIRVAADAEFQVASSKIVDRRELSFSEQLQAETDEDDQDQRVSQARPANQIKPGNLIYLRVKDADRDVSTEADKIVVKLMAESGDEVQVALTETGPHTGVFEGTCLSGELPAGALASDAAIEHGALMAIDQDPESYWLSEPDGATPKSLTVDMKDLRVVSRLRITTPDAERHAPVRGEIFGSNDGRFWFRIASNPPYAAVENVADEFGRMKARIYAGNYTNYSEWSQIVSLGRNSTPLEEQESVERLEWQRPATEEDANQSFAALWHGKFVQDRAGAVRFAVQGARTALAIDGQLELPVGPGNRTVDVWLERGTHDLTIFAAATNGPQGVAATLARADHNASTVVLVPFRSSDFDLDDPTLQPARLREAARAEISETEWSFAFEPQELRYVRFVIHEYLGEAVAISHFEVGGELPDQLHIPTEADVLSLAANQTLEIAGGDVVTATYTDDFTQRESGGSRLLTSELTATYFDARVTPINYDFVQSPNGAVQTIRKELMRIDPGERFIVEIVDYDQDQTDAPDEIKFEVIINDGEPIEYVAQENDNYSGIFTKEIDTSAKPEPEKIAVKQGDRIYIRYYDSQNTFPGHAVPRESIVYVHKPTEAQIRILETRLVPPDLERNRPQQILYQNPDPAAELSHVAFEAPLTIEVIDPDAAKDSRSSVTVAVTTTDGARIDVECVISDAFSRDGISGVSNWPLLEGRFIGQVIQQLGSRNSSSTVPVTSNMPRNLVGGPRVESEDGMAVSALDRSLITGVLNLTGKDTITATYKDALRPQGMAIEIAARGRLISNGSLRSTDREYSNDVTHLHVGEKLYLLVVDADQDSSDERDTVEVQITSEFGEAETVRLFETLAHSGIFTGSLTLRSNEQPTAGNLNVDDPVIECYFGDKLTVRYLDPAASTQSGELEVVNEIPVVIGTDGLVLAFSKAFNDESLAVETKFHIAESYFELFKSHKSLGRTDEEKADLEAGRRILREVMEDYPDPKYAPRVAYLLGQFAQELQQWHEAIESYSIIVRRYPEHTLAADAQYKLAQTYEEAGDFDQALEAYVTLAATYPKSPLIASVMIRISDHFYKAEQFDVAAQVGEKFLEKHEGHQYASRMAFRIGQCFYKSKTYREAGSAFDRFIKQFPDDTLASDALFWAGESFRMGRDNIEAFRRYNRCRWDFPESEAAKYARGRLALPEMLQQFEREANNLEDPDN